MSLHKELRKKSKKLRRKLIRQKNAQEKQQNLAKSYLTKSYLTNLAEQKILEILNEEKEDKLYLENYQKWLQTEKEFQEAFRAKQSAQDLECLRATEANINEPEKSNFSDIEFLLNDIEAYIDGSSELPAQLLRYVETNNEMELCQFYLKTGCCRFGKLCIKNHIQPGVSRVLVLHNFFKYNDTISDCGHGSHKQVEAYQEFYQDVLPEFEAIGNVTQFLVCCNHIQHLNGNVFVEFESERKAAKAFQIMQSRCYGGHNLNVDFVTISSWKAALCGLALQNKCPKGKNCNFLHIYIAPKNRFPDIVDEKSFKVKSIRRKSSNKSEIRSHRLPSCRWSEDDCRIEVRSKRKSKIKHKQSARKLKM